MSEAKYAWELPVTAAAGKKPREVKGQPWTEMEVYRRLKFVFPSPAFVLLPQVRSCTGFAKQYRTIDALAASVYPSRGLYLAGIEIKVTKTDWRKELREPEKSEELTRFCRYFYVACPTGVVPEGELPEAWGLIEVRADGATITRRAAVREDVDPPDISMVCSILRTASQALAPTEHLEDTDGTESDTGE